MDTTWGQKKNHEDMTNTNEEVIRRAEAALNKQRILRLEETELKQKEKERGLIDHPDHLVTIPKWLWKPKRLKMASEGYQEQRRELIAEVLRQPKWPREYNDPIKACKVKGSLRLSEFPGKKRDGLPRHNWWLEGIKEYWDHITNPTVGGNTRFTSVSYTHLTLPTIYSV